MDIEQFATRFGVQYDVHHLRDLIVRTIEDGHFKHHRRAQWVLTYVCPEADGDSAERLLVLDYQTGPDTGEEDIDGFEVLATAILDSREGNQSFEEYVSTWGDIQPDNYGRYSAPMTHTPARLHARWRQAGELYDRINDWCNSPQMRAALSDIQLS